MPTDLGWKIEFAHGAGRKIKFAHGACFWSWNKANGNFSLYLEKNKYYELNRDDIFLNEAKKNLIENPLRYFNLYLKKIFSFYFIDFNSTYPNYYNYFNIFPALIFGILSFPGLFIFFGKKNVKYNYITLYLLLNLLIFSIFFILPRYKLIILPIQIIIASNFVCYFLGKMGKKDKKNNIN